MRSEFWVSAVLFAAALAAEAQAQPAASDAGPDRQIAVSVRDSCSAPGFDNDNCEFDKPANRAFLADAIARGLTVRGFTAVAADQSPGRTLIVTVTGIGTPDGAKASASADYQLMKGDTLLGPAKSAKSIADDTRPGLQKLADQIVADVPGPGPATEAAASAAISGPASTAK